MCWINSLEGESLGVSGSDTEEEFEPEIVPQSNATVGAFSDDEGSVSSDEDPPTDPEAPVSVILLSGSSDTNLMIDITQSSLPCRS